MSGEHDNPSRTQQIIDAVRRGKSVNVTADKVESDVGRVLDLLYPAVAFLAKFFPFIPSGDHVVSSDDD
ncbi:MAG: hypothetical protein PVJ09_00045 [Candidatus Woesebacteria bacterium]|jgi:hypothetical protein